MSTVAARLLVIDEDPATAGALCAMLAAQGAHATPARDGAQGLAQAAACRPDLVLLDLDGAGSGGLATCRRLRADPFTSAIPVVVLGADAGVERRLHAFEAGASDCLAKPYSEPELLARVRVHVGLARRIRGLEAAMAACAAARLPGQGRSRDDALFERACELLGRSLGAPPGLLQLAHRLGTNERKLNEIFRRRMGLTVFDYLLELRLGSARRLLEASGLQVQQIADAVGYQNAGDFTRAFRRRYGMTPGHFRLGAGARIDG